MKAIKENESDKRRDLFKEKEKKKGKRGLYPFKIIRYTSVFF